MSDRRRIRNAGDLAQVDFAKQGGLVPVVVQDGSTRDVLMVAWADRAAVEETLRSGEMHFHSRSRDELWRKGETSGNVQRLLSLHADCDADTLLALVDPAGPACHTGDRTCFDVERESADASATSAGHEDVLHHLASVLAQRDRDRPDGSYTTRLLEDENLRLKKLGEETVELVAALVRGGDDVAAEAADLLYHVLVALLGAGVRLDDVLEELEDRRRS